MDDDRREATLQFIREAFSPAIAAQIEETEHSEAFAGELTGMAMDRVFGGLWLRPGLDRRSRSLVTVALLIGQRAFDELKIHAVAAINNGVTLEELAEVVYQASAYAGFPAANGAVTAMAEALRREGKIE